MATATITALMVDVDLCNTGAPTLENTGHSNVSMAETDLQKEGAGCYACGYVGAVGSTAPTTADFSAMYIGVTSFSGANRHLGLWMRTLYPVFDKVDGGVSLYLGDNTDRGLWYATGNAEGYSGGWYYFVLNIDSTGPASDLNYGVEPGHTGFTRIGSAFNISASKGEAFLQNQYFDVIRRTDANGDFGLQYTGGLTGNRVTFADMAAADTLGYGTFIDIGGVYTVAGQLFFGVAAGTFWLQDNTKTVIFRDLPVASDFYKVTARAGTTGVTNIDLSNVVWQGLAAAKFLFDMSALATGDTAAFVAQTFINGGVIKFGAQSTVDVCKFVACTDIQPNGITITDPIFENCDKVTLTVASDKIDGGNTELHNTLTGVPFVTTDDLTKVANHAFVNTGGVGHAIELTSNTGSPFTFVGNTFTGYGVDGSNDAALYNNSGGAVIINITGGGGTPTVRNGTSASTTINNTVTVKVTALTSTGSVIASARVILEAATGGNLPAQDSVTITRVTTTATVAHTAHGLVTGDRVTIRGANQQEYNGIFTVTVTTANAYTYTVSGSPATPATGTITSTFVVIDGLTDVFGVVQNTGFNYIADQPVTGNVRKSTAAPFYKSFGLTGTIVTTGLTLVAQLIDDQ